MADRPYYFPKGKSFTGKLRERIEKVHELLADRDIEAEDKVKSITTTDIFFISLLTNLIYHPQFTDTLTRDVRVVDSPGQKLKDYRKFLSRQLLKFDGLVLNYQKGVVKKDLKVGYEIKDEMLEEAAHTAFTVMNVSFVTAKSFLENLRSVGAGYDLIVNLLLTALDRSEIVGRLGRDSWR